ncbi:MAG TPA: DUF2130 domain-containing protein, partial [Ferruginibacter sp.]|nr:DUF2130 domain-containing protein [Ferruginibacter sp.]
IKKKEEEFDKQKKDIETAATKKATDELAARLKLAEEEAKNKSQQLQDLQKKELELLRDKSVLEEKQRNIEMELEKRFLEKRKEIEDSTIKSQQEIFELRAKNEREQFDLRAKEFHLRMEQQQKLIEELKRKSEQGSMQLQGESQEVLLEDILKEHFPFDLIEEVGKGVEGADCIQTIRNNIGMECGKIIYESKRTKAWSNAWVDKLKHDKRTKGADVAILVTQVFPRELTRFGERDGIWICNFQEVGSVAMLMRRTIIDVYEANKRQDNKGDKMQMLYDFLTGNEFRGQMEAIVEGFLSMKQSITKERIQMERIWKEREKQLEKVLLNTGGMYGSIKGIAGASIADIPLLEAGDDDPEEA